MVSNNDYGLEGFFLFLRIFCYPCQAEFLKPFECIMVQCLCLTQQYLGELSEQEKGESGLRWVRHP